MIKLTKIEYITSGPTGAQKLESQLSTAIWVNPTLMSHFEQETKWIGGATRTLTRMAWSNGNHAYTASVQEGPDEIMNKIRISRATD